MLDEQELPPVEFELGEEEEQAIMEEQDRWQLVADGLLATADQEIFHPERQDWTLDEWIDWGTNTFFEPVADIEGWQDVLREAFTADFGEGSSRFWGDYIADVSDRIVSHLQQLRDRTIVGDEREEVEEDDDPDDEVLLHGGAFERPPDRTPEEVRELTRELRNQYTTAEILYLQGWLLRNELQQRQQRQRMNRVEDQWTFFTAQLTPELQRHIVRRADEHLELEVRELRREIREIQEQESEARQNSPATGGGVRHLIF